MLIGEEMLLLLLDKKKGKIPSNIKLFFKNAIPASIIEELRILGRIKIESEGNKAYIVLINNTPTNEPILDGILAEIINFQKTGKTLNLAMCIRGLVNKKRKWQDRLWADLENKGIIQNKKGKYYIINFETIEKLEKDIKDVVGNKIKPDERQKAIIGFFKHTRQLRMISKKSDRDKEWVNSFTEDCQIPKIFARHVLMPAALKKSLKMTSMLTAASAHISAASSQFESSVSGTSKDFKAVRSIGTTREKTWSGIQAEKTLEQKSLSGGGSLGDLLLKGAKKLKEKRTDKIEEGE